MKEALDEIYRLYAADVYRFALGLCRDETLAEDILQDTMLKAVQQIDKFEGRCSVKTWLCTIARNLYLNYVKRADNRNLPLEEAAASEAGEPIEERLSEKLQAQAIHRILHTLEEPYKEIFTLRVFAELKFEDIGALFGKSGNWARVTFFRAKEKIIRQLEQEGSL